MSKTGRIIITLFCQHIGFFCFKFVTCKVCKYSTLERIQETNTEIMGISLSYLWIGTCNTDCRNPALFENIRCCDGNTGAVRSKYNRNSITYQLGCSRWSFIIGGFIINNIQLYIIFLAINLYGRLYTVGILDTQRLLFTACTIVAGCRFIYTNLYCVSCKCSCCCGCHHRYCYCCAK